MNKFKFFLSLALIAIFSASVNAQTINKFFDRIEKGDDYAVISVNKEMFRMLSSMNVELDEPGLKELIAGIDMLKIYVKENGANSADYDEIKSLAQSSTMNNLLSIKDGSEHVFLYTVPGSSEDIVKSLLLLVKDTDQNVFIKLDGNINLKYLSKLTDKINISGLENLKKIDKKSDKKK